jgi:hypothetical protein
LNPEKTLLTFAPMEINLLHGSSTFIYLGVTKILNMR